MTPTPDLGMLEASARIEGSWHSPGYRSARTRARWAMALLAVTAVALVLLLLVTLSGYAFISKYLAGDVVTTADGDQIAANAATVGRVYFLALLATGIAFLAWLSRSVDNVPPLGGGTPRYSPRWSIGWWFVPVAFFWKPYSVVRELAERLAVAGRSSTRLVVGWWMLFVGGIVVNEISSLMAVSTDPTAEQIRQALMVNAAGLLCLTIAAILGLLVVRGIQGLADARAARLDLEARSAVWPTAASMTAAQGVQVAQSVAAQASGATDPASTDPMVSADDAGATVEATSYAAFCPSCGRARLDDERFCARCGTDLAVG